MDGRKKSLLENKCEKKTGWKKRKQRSTEAVKNPPRASPHCLENCCSWKRKFDEVARRICHRACVRWTRSWISIAEVQIRKSPTADRRHFLLAKQKSIAKLRIDHCHRESKAWFLILHTKGEKLQYNYVVEYLVFNCFITRARENEVIWKWCFAMFYILAKR